MCHLHISSTILDKVLGVLDVRVCTSRQGSQEHCNVLGQTVGGRSYAGHDGPQGDFRLVELW